MTRAQAVDVAKRAGWTFLQTFLAVFVLSSPLGANASSLAAAAFAGAAAVQSMLKSVAAAQLDALKAAR